MVRTSGTAWNGGTLPLNGRPVPFQTVARLNAR